MTTITDKEAPQVWRLLKRYRRQISSPHKANLLMMADELAAPDFRKQQALQRERDRYAQAMQNARTHRREAAAGDVEMQTRADSAASRSVQ